MMRCHVQAWQGFVSHPWYETTGANITGLTKQAGIAYAGASALTQMSAFDERVVFHFDGANGDRFVQPNLATASGASWVFAPNVQPA